MLSADLLSATAGLLLSLAASYFPKFSDWYAALDGVRKRQVMAALLALSALGIVAQGCLTNWSCYVANAPDAARAFFEALVVNQAVFLITKRK